MNINSFLEKFNSEYNFLYDNRDCVAGFSEAVDAFGSFLESHKSFVSEFVRFRGDVISSDREAAAFMFALESFM